MPVIATTDNDLIDEAQRWIAAAEQRLHTTDLPSLIAARQHIELGAAVLDDVISQDRADVRDLNQRHQRAQDTWDTHVRSSATRQQILRAVAPPDRDDEPTRVWTVNGYPASELGHVALAAFAAAWPTPPKQGASGLHHCLWGPHWLLNQLIRGNLIRVNDAHSWPATRNVAETLATLWTPTGPGSTYREGSAAYAAASAICAN